MRINNPMTPEQSKQGDLIPPGNYQFEVMEAKESMSKAGNDMIELKLKIFMPDGRERVIFDYLLEALEFKLAHFMECVGLFDKYTAGKVEAHDCWGKSGEVKIYIQKDKSGQYPDKSAVGDYLLTDAQNAVKQERKAAELPKNDFTNDEIPF
jgi:hypothetical protein